MVSTKKLLQMAKKWQKLAAASRRRISWRKPAIANKGHFIVYTTDERRFMIPLMYLKSEIVRVLLRMAEEEFGVPSDGPITLPFDSVFMEYALSILRRHVTEDMESAIILSLESCRSSSASCSQQDQTSQQPLMICSF